MKKLILMTCLFSICSFANEPLKLVTLDYPPYIEVHEDKIDGVAVRLVEAIFSKLDVEISIEVLPWGRAISYIESGTADGIFTAFKTLERERFADYSQQVLFEQNITMATLKVSDLVWDYTNLSDWEICVVSNVSYGKWLDGVIDSNRFKAVHYVTATEQCVLMLLSGRVDLWPSNEYGARSIAAKMGVSEQIHLMDPPIESTPSYIAFSKLNQHRELIKAFDNELKSMKSEGQYDHIIETYFSELDKF
ncbi:transporter substrate-binding domain-containing protein [Vibrio sp. T187]|uniref:substrate-binding periplasmic protein n=1 Tax=Vibrio TaxID=662 RepID=UPI0010C9AB78|nr:MULTISPECIES: transporter substrate-binding domain-containing protein [Vibrio]MBW3696246.1 transporter substrate-binding domain-containing protein [Vibrio sp. T187]